MANVLLVEDDLKYRRLIEDALKLDGYSVITAGDGLTALQVIIDAAPDLVLLDVLLPGIDGFEVCRRIRRLSNLPVILITGLDSGQFKVHGLDLGADDFVTKPFDVEELLARVRARLRRSHGSTIDTVGGPQVLKLGEMTIDSSQQRAFVGQEEVYLTATEFALLWQLVANAGKVMVHSALLESVWGVEPKENSGCLKVIISRLRSKLEEDPRKPRHIITRPGIGYIFQPEGRRTPLPPLDQTGSRSIS